MEIIKQWQYQLDVSRIDTRLLFFLEFLNGGRILRPPTHTQIVIKFS